ncbi:YRA1 (YDR381W) [Zygosaccharomyces parabailii]|nr:YRA1 (YDR381W) [Zygosaccharomyces parabailii]CDH12027.1 probable RNA annealing protein YRA1 [Zygosaccharomyces bailii ISA1307]
MSVNLDKSLDEIIGSSKKQARSRVGVGKRAVGGGPKKVSKQLRRQPAPGKKVRAPANVAAVKMAKLLDASREAKVNVEGLPRDIKQDAVKEFFASQVGGVMRVLLSYNERGQSTGMANITFRNGEMAKRAVAKFNGAPIDGGRTRLKLNLIIDPTQQPVRSLSERIRAVPAPRKAATVKKGPNKRAAILKKARAKQPKERQPKKSLEDLDKEMADYFEEKQ